MSEPRRFILYRCNGCGAVSDATGLDRFGKHLVTHGVRYPGQPLEVCAQPSERITVVEAAPVDALVEALERIANHDWTEPPAEMPDEMARTALAHYRGESPDE